MSLLLSCLSCSLTLTGNPTDRTWRMGNPTDRTRAPPRVPPLLHLSARLPPPPPRCCPPGRTCARAAVWRSWTDTFSRWECACFCLCKSVCKCKHLKTLFSFFFFVFFSHNFQICLMYLTQAIVYIHVGYIIFRRKCLNINMNIFLKHTPKYEKQI